MEINNLLGFNLPSSLSDEEFNKLLELSKKGENDARNKLIIYNIRLVLFEVLKKFSFVDYDKFDLVSIGYIGLINAIDTYDIPNKYNFSTYAFRLIDNEILSFLRINRKRNNIISLDSTIDNTIECGLMDTDIVYDYERKEEHMIIKTLVNKLEERDREIIMMYFGFYNNRIYNQKEIADKFNLSQSHVSRIIEKIINKLGKQYKEVTNEIYTNSKKEKKCKKKLQTIYEYFNDYTKEQVDEVISCLSDEEQDLIKLKYGNDLECPNQIKLESRDSYRFYNLLIPKIKVLLLKTPHTLYINSIFKEKEILVIMLRFGYIDGLILSIEEISQLLEISEKEVIDIINKVSLNNKQIKKLKKYNDYY